MLSKFSVIAPTLPLLSDLQAIKSAVLAARSNPQRLEFDQDVLASFAPRLEGNWGSLYEKLPVFFSELVSGRWTGGDTQSVPTSLLGDFGEFVGFSIFSTTCAGRAHAARVIRPSGYKRPDFLVFDSGTGQLTALECKSRAENAMRLRRRAGGGHLTLSLCGAVRGRRDDGLEQVASEVVIRQRTTAGNYPVERPVAELGVSRIVANRSAIVTPLFVDGRLESALRNASVSKPLGCGHSCVACLLSGPADPLVLSPIFLNNSKIIDPVSPEGMDGASFHSAYSMAGQALWVRSARRFSDAWYMLVKHLLNAREIEQRPIDYILPLLDVLAAALELDLAPNPADALKPIRERFSTNKEVTGTLSAALALHAWEEEFPWDEAPRDASKTAPIPSPPLERKPEPHRHKDRSWDEDYESQSGRRRRMIPLTLPALPLEVWQERFGGRLRQTDREDIKSIPLQPNTPWETVRELLQGNERNERSGRIHLQGDSLVEFSRPPVGSDGTSELRLTGTSPEVVRSAVDGFIDLFQSHRKRARARRGREQQATIREKVVASWRTDFFPAEQDGDEELRAIIDDEGFARILLTRAHI